MKMTNDPIRERDLEHAGIDSGAVKSDGHRVTVELDLQDFDRLMRLAQQARYYWWKAA
jgi:hypothetical protein